MAYGLWQRIVRALKERNTAAEAGNDKRAREWAEEAARLEKLRDKLLDTFNDGEIEDLSEAARLYNEIQESDEQTDAPAVRKLQQENETKHYLPKPGENPDCYKCDYERCPAKHKSQRSRLDFTVTSCRCPRLPDKNGIYDPDWFDLWEQVAE